MRVFPFKFCLATLPLLVFPVTGCDSDASQRVPVHGKVSYHGNPLSTGMVVFIPDPNRGANGPLARAEVQQDGSYDLQTDDCPGANPGWYRVTIVAVAADSPSHNRPFALPRSLIPEKYRDPELSGLVCEIRPGRENCINFNLE